MRFADKIGVVAKRIKSSLFEQTAVDYSTRQARRARQDPRIRIHWPESALTGKAERVRSAQILQTSTCSAMARAELHHERG